MTDVFSEFAARLHFAAARQAHDDEFNALALELFALQFRHNQPYRKFCEARDASPKNVNHSSEIPAVPTSAFKELDISCLPPEKRTKVFHSSGTTEQKPSRHFHNADSVAVYEASLWPCFAAHLLDDFKFEISDLKLLILTPPATQAPNSSLVHMFETIRRKLCADNSAFVGKISSDGSWTLDFQAAETRIRKFAGESLPVLILGTAFSFVHLLDFLAEENLKFNLPAGSRAMETGGYKGRSRTLLKTELHGIISKQLGIPATNIVCEYGMSELSSQAYDRVAGDVQTSRHSSLVTRHFSFPPWSRAQIISPETGNEVADGETGLIRVFHLANVCSVMAIQTEDLGIRRGDGFELIGRAEFAEQRGCSLMSGENFNAKAQKR